MEDREPLDRLLSEAPKMGHAILAAVSWIVWRSPPSLIKKWFMSNTGAKVVHLLSLVESCVIHLKVRDSPLEAPGRTCT